MRSAVPGADAAHAGAVPAEPAAMLVMREHELVGRTLLCIELAADRLASGAWSAAGASCGGAASAAHTGSSEIALLDALVDVMERFTHAHHESTEEASLFPLVADVPGADHVAAQLARDHVAARALTAALKAAVEAVAAAPRTFDATTPLARASAALRAHYLAHMLREDEWLLPLERSLPPERRHALDAAYAERSAASLPAAERAAFDATVTRAEDALGVLRASG